MRAFVTGATGFIGGRLAEKLRQRGDEVVALVRTPSKAGGLTAAGCHTVEGDLADTDAIRRAVEGCDAVFHVGAMYEIGVRPSARDALWDANVEGTERVLSAAEDAGVARIVHVSTGNVFGNTHAKVVDETYQRDLSDGFLSIYDETKYHAHQVAQEHIAKGSPVLIAMPGGVYGPGDSSPLASFIDLILTGKMKLLTFPESGINLVHVDDVAEGLLLIHDQGRVGESYALGGQCVTYRQLAELLGRVTGRKVPKRALPVALMKAGIPFGPLIGKLMNQGPNLRELIRTAHDVTFWFTDAKARRELGYAPRDAETGLRQTYAEAA
ncbi:MAG TPA: NAD-dependent epimerase/dehydratase family protein [Actinomycetota bacterium]|nr:NAD-dependent epimerase/dehydratase family protein [Actinomycetota bacterium]